LRFERAGPSSHIVSGDDQPPRRRAPGSPPSTVALRPAAAYARYFCVVAKSAWPTRSMTSRGSAWRIACVPNACRRSWERSFVEAALAELRHRQGVHVPLAHGLVADVPAQRVAEDEVLVTREPLALSEPRESLGDARDHRDRPPPPALRRALSAGRPVAPDADRVRLEVDVSQRSASSSPRRSPVKAAVR
jgi:hypothetical protein